MTRPGPRLGGEKDNLVKAEELQRLVGELPLRDPACVPSTALVRDAVLKLQEAGTGCVLVTDTDGQLVGLFTERDVLRRLAPLGTAGGSLPITDLMTERPTMLHSDDTIVYALHEMHVGGYRHIPVVDSDGRPVKLISVRHVVDFLAAGIADGTVGTSAGE